MPVSEKKLIANRLNAKKSTGFKTFAGKLNPGKIAKKIPPTGHYQNFRKGLMIAPCLKTKANPNFRFFGYFAQLALLQSVTVKIPAFLGGKFFLKMNPTSYIPLPFISLQNCHLGLLSLAIPNPLSPSHLYSTSLSWKSAAQGTGQNAPWRRLMPCSR
jgi:hypothetical protein